MKLLSELQQDSQDWHARRKLSIGSSDAPVIMGIDPYRTYDQLFKEKTGQLKSEFKMNEAMALGKKWEGAAREMCNLVHDSDFQPVVGIHDDFNFLLASFDGLCAEKKAFIEIKYVGHKKLNQLKSIIPDHHYAQMQHQFLVSDYNGAFYVPYALSKDKKSIDRLEIIPIDRDASYIEELLQVEKKFWEAISSWIEEHQPKKL